MGEGARVGCKGVEWGRVRGVRVWGVRAWNGGECGV